MKQTWEGPEEKNIFVIVVIRHLFERTVLRPTHSLILKERSDLHVRSAIIQQITADHWKCMRSSTLGQNYTHVINAKSPMQQLVIWKLTCSRTQTRNHTSAQFVNIQPLQPRLSGFSFVWVSMWVLKWAGCRNDLLQWSHLWGFTLLCASIWVLRDWAVFVE